MKQHLVGGTTDTPRELVQRALRGLDTPRPAHGPLAVHYCARLAGVTLQQYSTNAAIMSESIVRYYEQIQPDAVWLSADTWVTAEAMGAQVGCTDVNQPIAGVGDPAVQTAADIDRIPPPDPYSQARLPRMLEALRNVVKELGNRAFVVACFDQYPFSLACALMGINRVMTLLVDDPSMVVALMHRCVEYTTAYAQALAEAGADMLSGGDSPAVLIGPDNYRKFALPFEQKLIAAIRQHTSQPVSLHICGNPTSMLSDMVASTADVLELDYQVDLQQACQCIANQTAIWGNLDPVGVLAQGDTNKVRQATSDFIRAMQAAEQTRFVVSSGCTIAMETPPENLHAMLNACTWSENDDQR
jgi:MtaA/CmuA family methyltransferase